MPSPLLSLLLLFLPLLRGAIVLPAFGLSRPLVGQHNSTSLDIPVAGGVDITFVVTGNAASIVAVYYGRDSITYLCQGYTYQSAEGVGKCSVSPGLGSGHVLRVLTTDGYFNGTDVLNYTAPVLGGTPPERSEPNRNDGYTNFALDNLPSVNPEELQHLLYAIATRLEGPLWVDGPTFFPMRLEQLMACFGTVTFVDIVPAGNYSLVLCADNQCVAPPTIIVMDIPMVMSIKGCSDMPPATVDCTTDVLTEVTVTGTGFGEDALVNITDIYSATGSVLLSITHRSATEISFYVPVGFTGVQLPVRVTQSSPLAGELPLQSFNYPGVTLSFARPSITALSGCNAPPGTFPLTCLGSGGAMLVIEGQNWGQQMRPLVTLNGSMLIGCTQDALLPYSKLHCPLQHYNLAVPSPDKYRNGTPLFLQLRVLGEVTPMNARFSVAYLVCPPGSRENFTVPCPYCERACFACGVDTVSFAPAATSCFQCANQRSTGGLTNQSLCLGCVAGYRRDVIAGTCNACPVNTYRASSSSVSLDCTACTAPHTTRSQIAQSSCAACEAGTRGDFPVCTACPADTYQSSELDVNTSCTRCEVGRTTLGFTGQSTCTFCDAGFELSGVTACTACGVNQFKPLAGTGTCQECPLNSNTRSKTGQSFCVCVIEPFNNVTQSESCTAPPSSSDNAATVAVVAGVLAAVVLAALILWCTCCGGWAAFGYRCLGRSKGLKFDTEMSVTLIDGSEVHLESVVGEGFSAQVWRAMWRGREVAAKVMRNQQLTGHAREEFEHEVRMASVIGNHPSVVPFLGVCAPRARSPPGSGAASPSASGGKLTVAGNSDSDSAGAADVKSGAGRLMLIMSYQPFGSVHDLLIRHKKIPVVDASLSDAVRVENARTITKMAVDASAGVLQLHAQGVVHSDIAARNFLVDPFRRVLISDFGMSRQLSNGQTFVRASAKELLPLKWAAPEMIQDHIYSEKTDVYMFGVALYEMVIQRDPYPGTPTSEFAKCVPQVLQADKPLRPNIHPRCPRELAELMVWCWAATPEHRPTMQQLNENLHKYYVGLATAVKLNSVGGASPEAPPAAARDSQSLGAVDLTYEPYSPYTPYQEARGGAEENNEEPELRVYNVYA